MQQTKIWDLATRTFHWALAAAVFVCFVSGEDEGLAFTIHAYAGFLVFMLLVFRLGWGVAGSRHSRFADFAFPATEVKSYLLSVLRFRPDHHVGHNPAGGLMIFLMLVVLGLSAATGITMVVAKIGWLEDVHEVLGTLMQVLVGIHIVGVIAEQLLTRQKLVQAMVSGTKELSEDAARREPPLAPAWRSAVLAVLVVALGVTVFNQTNFGSAVSSFAAEEQARHADND